MFEDDFDDDMFDDLSAAKGGGGGGAKGGGKSSKKDEAAKKLENVKASKQRERAETGKKNANAKDDWPDSDSSIDSRRENMSAQDRIAAMKARLAGIRASDIPEDDFVAANEPKSKTKPMNPQVGFKTAQPSKAVQQSLAAQAAQQAKKPQRFSAGEDDELYEEFEMPSMKKGGGDGKKPKPPPPPRGAGGAPMDESSDDVPEIDTRIRSTMALEKHWNEVEEKRKRDEALRKRKLKEKHAEIVNEEQRLLFEIQEKKRKEEELRKRLAEEELRKAMEDWKQKEEETRKKFDAKLKAKELQLQRLEEAKTKRIEAKKKLTDENERRQREYEAEMARLTGEEEEFMRKIAEEEESKRQIIAEEDKRRVEEQEKREKAEEERKRKEAEEEMRMLEEEEKELLRREKEIERELEEKRRKREGKLKEIQAVLQANQAKKEAEERKLLSERSVSDAFNEVLGDVEEDEDLVYDFCFYLGATARRIKGTLYAGVFSGAQAVDCLVNELGACATRQEGASWCNKRMERGLFWPLEGKSAFEDNQQKLYNLEDSHPIVQRSREDADKAAGGGGGAVAAPPASVSPRVAQQQQQQQQQQVQQQAAPAAGAPVAELRVVDDANQQLPKYEFELFLGQTSIGRRSDNSISLPVLSVSKKHATFDCQPDGSFFVIDLGSSNKTRLFADASVAQPVILRPNIPYQVYSGAEILFGEIRCAFTAFGDDAGGGAGVVAGGAGGDNELYYDEVADDGGYEYEYVYEEGGATADQQGWTQAEQLKALEEAQREVQRAGGGRGQPAARGAAQPSKEELDRFSVAPPQAAAPLPPGAMVPRSLGVPMKAKAARGGRK